MEKINKVMSSAAEFALYIAFIATMCWAIYLLIYSAVWWLGDP